MANGSLSQFKATLARKIERNQKRQGRFDKKLKSNSIGSKTEFDFPKPSKSELIRIKNSIKKKLKSDHRKQLITIIATLVILAIMIIYILYPV